MRSKNIITKPVFVGLIFLFAISIGIASRRKPVEIYERNYITKVSNEERKTIDNRYLQSGKVTSEDTIWGRAWYKFESHPVLANIFPQVNFYLAFIGKKLPAMENYLAEYKNKFYQLPAEFNRLLIENGIEVNDNNIIDIAKISVVIASGQLR